MRILLTALVCLFFSSLVHAELIPVTELSHENAFKNFKLSPDGKAVVYSETVQGVNQIKILNLETGEKVGINLLGSKKSWSQGSRVFWITDERLIYSNRSGYEAINRDGSKGRTVGAGIRWGDVLQNLRFSDEGNLLITTLDLDVTSNNSYGASRYDFLHPGVAKVDIGTGNVSIIEQNPGNITLWMVTPDGEIPVAVELEGTRYRTVHRKSEKSGWVALPGLDWDDPQARPLGFGDNGRTLYVSKLNANGFWAVYTYDLNTYKFGPVILENENYDIIPQMDGSSQDGLIYSPDDKRLLGIRYVTAYPQVYWLDQGLGEVQLGLDQALKGKVNTITSMSDDLQKLVIHSWSDRDPGTYYLFDREKQSLSMLMQSTPWIKEEKMAKMRPMKIKARDGVTLYGYMTLPLGKKAKDLPLVVMDDNNFWQRSVWTFDRTAQFLANRGYAVLELNVRGNTGFGDDFKRKGYRNTEGARADLADAVKWAISKGIVNPDRVAILGQGTMQGLNALVALAEYPDLYACGVASSPYTDWKEVISADTFIDDYLVFLHERLGDPNDPSDPLSQKSPIQLVDQIKAPVLITHTENIKPLYYTFTKKMVNALEKSGSIVQFETDYDMDYGFENYGKWMEDIAAFLTKHMPE